VDWGRFEQLAQFHRVEGICWDCLAPHESHLPAAVADALSSAATAIALQNLSATAESATLMASFRAAKVPILFLKGLTLGSLAYRNYAAKSAIDIDLLINPADLDASASLLRTLGYRLVIPRDSAGKEALRAWHRLNKESVWVKGESGLQIDLHTRTADNPALIPGITVHAPSRSVDVGGVELPTLAPEELFSYLAVHGASSAWFRLKWISDFAGLLHPLDTHEVEQLYRRSQELEAGRAVGQALLLADTLFGSMGENDSLRRELSADRTIRWLFHAALRRVCGPPEEPTEHRFGTLAIHATQFLLKPGIRYKASELAGQMSRFVARQR